MSVLKTTCGMCAHWREFAPDIQVSLRAHWNDSPAVLFGTCASPRSAIHDSACGRLIFCDDDDCADYGACFSPVRGEDIFLPFDMGPEDVMQARHEGLPA